MKKLLAAPSTPPDANKYQSLLVVFLIILLLPSQLAAQQVEMGESFIAAICQKEYLKAWQMLDENTQKGTTLAAFEQAVKPVIELSAQFGPAVKLFMRGSRAYTDGTSLVVYTYQFNGDVTKGFPSVLLDVAFKDTSAKTIVGFTPKYNNSPSLSSSSGPVATSSGEEEPLEQQQVWRIDQQQIQIHQLALIHDRNHTAMLAIKVFAQFPDDITMDQAKQQALPIVRYAVAHGYLEKARQAAQKTGTLLVDNIGVALIKPGTKNGYRVQISPQEYTK